MKNPERYKIAFSSLKPGTHSFDFQVDSSFFEEYEEADISGGHVDVTVLMVREERMMDLHLELKGVVTVACDRCLEPVEIPVEGSERLILKLGDRYYEESEEVQIIPETDHQVDLAPFLYEYINLLLPMRRVHSESGEGQPMCNPEVIRMLNEMQPARDSDPRWDALRRLEEPPAEN